MMKSRYQKIHVCLIVTASILFFSTFAFAQYEGVSGVRLTDESVVYGSVKESGPDEIQIETKAGKTLFLKKDRIKKFIPGESVRGIQFNDGTTVYGNILEMNSSKVIILTKENETVTRNFKDIDSYIKDDDGRKMSNRQQLTLGVEVSSFKYEEPDLMKDTGVMYGIVGSYTYRNKIMSRLEGKFAYALLDYDGGTWGGDSLKVSGISDYLIELRWLIGYDFVPTQTITITPHAGLAYRYLQDNMQEKYAGGYQRESNYVYLPLGLQTVARLGGGWSLGVNAEFDVFLWGRQISYIKNVDPGYNTLENEQLHGYGVRGSIAVAKEFSKVGFLIEPYIRYWNIKESNYDYLTYEGMPVAYGFEPNNETTEIGCKVALTF